MTVPIIALLSFTTLAVASRNDQTQIEKYGEKVETYHINVPGKPPIEIIETGPAQDVPEDKWERISAEKENEDVVRHMMTHIIHDYDGNKPRCYGPSCREEMDDSGPTFSEQLEEKVKDYGSDYSADRLQAIQALAAKLKKNKHKTDRYSSNDEEEKEEENNGKVYTSWNKLKLKHHKHPYDDKTGWVTLEPIAWSTSKISKWKPNVKKQKPNQWNVDDERFPDDDRFNSFQNSASTYTYSQKRPVGPRPVYINNKLQMSTADDDINPPTKPSWQKPNFSYNYQSTWSADEGRHPIKHQGDCEDDENDSNDDTVYYGMADSIITERPSKRPYEYAALHQSSQKRPVRRPTPVVYAGAEDYEDEPSKPPFGDGQWVLLSTTKAYKNKKRPRALNVSPEKKPDASVVSHQAVALTVLPVNDYLKNMSTSHGGLLEVEKSFQTVEESRRNMEKVDLSVASSEVQPTTNKRVIRRRIFSNVGPDRSAVLAAVGAGMLPATMAMMMPMMLGRRKRRETENPSEDLNLYRLNN